MTKSKKLRVAHVARAIEKPESTIRTWLKREQVMLPGLSKSGWLDTAPRDGWREFTWSDVATFAVVSKLVDYGWRVEVASTVAENLQRKLPKAFGPECNDPLGIIAECSDHLAILQGDGDRRSEMAIMSRKEFAETRLLDSKNNPLTDYLVLDLGALVKAAFRRAESDEQNTEGETE